LECKDGGKKLDNKLNLLLHFWIFLFSLFVETPEFGVLNNHLKISRLISRIFRTAHRFEFLVLKDSKLAACR